MKKCLIILLSSFLLSCGTPPKPYSLPKDTQKIVRTAESRGFSLHRYQGEPFLLTAYERLTPSNAEKVYVYIEGDGNSWKTKYRLSDNPTPKQPLALQLATLDPHSNVVYLARPCQYTPPTLNPSCTPEFWSSHRYAEEIIKTMDQTLDQIKAKQHNVEFTLVGFSGGASVAALLASRRNDISLLITVAGDLDHVILNKHHRTTPLNGSLNPYTLTEKLNHIPQHHWHGSKDKIVPKWMGTHFVRALKNPPCAKAHVLNGATHHDGWQDEWQHILNSSVCTEDTQVNKRVSSGTEDTQVNRRVSSGTEDTQVNKRVPS